MRRTLRVYRAFFSSSLARELEFRANFLAKVGENLVWMTFFVMIVLVIYRNTDSVAGWSRGDSFVLVATCFFIEAVHSAFFMSLMELPEHVRKGTLDFVIVRPVDSQFWVSMRRFNFSQAGTLIAGLGMITVGVASLEHAPSATQWLAYGSLVVSGLVLFYSLNMAMMTLGIWLVRVDNLWVLSESAMQVSRFPLDIYSFTIRRVLTYALPIAFLATIPARQLVQGLDLRMVAVGATWAVCALIGARLFWTFALTRYQSASS